MNHDQTKSISSLSAPVSPPPPRPSQPKHRNLAAIESGQISLSQNHFGIISSQLSQYVRPRLPADGTPRIEICAWKDLYQRNTTPNHGAHFVIHQHDHPVAGPHYDLRLQFSSSSSLSWSIMYGLPGDANHRRINRNATETRVHCVWNHLIETASKKTGSLIIWDTGEYEILKESLDPQPETDSEGSTDEQESESLTESEKLRRAFQNKKIRLRLHGTRLPPNYTILLRLDKSEFNVKTATPRKRRRTQRRVSASQYTTSDSSSSDSSNDRPRKTSDNSKAHSDSGSVSDSDQVEEEIRLNNAYPGATNDIGSIHQRRWFLSLDRISSGFVEGRDSHSGRKSWVRRRGAQSDRLLGFEPFYVRGPEVERSIVTGRLGKDVLEDEGVEGFRPRRGWRAVLA